jgi:tRNA threonylcarbamoyladenosine biosynthesis protein TsaE
VPTPPAITRISTSEDYTQALGHGLADLLRPGDVLTLSGQLGSGKTTLVRAIAAGLGIDVGLVSSPTFVFVNQYPIPRGPLAGGQLVHVDAYRLHGVDELEPLGWDRLFDQQTKLAAGKSAAVVEWAERIAGALPPPEQLVRVELVAEGQSQRRITIHAPQSWAGRPRFEQLAEREPTACRATGRWVSPTSPTYPFIDERSRDADMFQWFTGGYKTSREVKPSEE